DLAVSRFGRQVGREECAGGIDRCLDFAGGAVDVAAEVELEGDVAGAHGTAGGHLGNAGDVGELLFEGCGDGGSHHVGAGAGEAGAHHDGGEVHFGECGHRKERI